MKTIIILAFVGLALGFPGTSHFFPEINFTKIFVKMVSRKKNAPFKALVRFPLIRLDTDLPSTQKRKKLFP